MLRPGLPRWGTGADPGHIEMFYNPQRKHARNGMLSPIDFEQ